MGGAPAAVRRRHRRLTPLLRGKAACFSAEKRPAFPRRSGLPFRGKAGGRPGSGGRPARTGGRSGPDDDPRSIRRLPCAPPALSPSPSPEPSR
ncbi:hypothetical protein DQ239_18105 [Blastococcus sp. TF02-09]|nr:hypothetical protein DQ239_18105 [Blastococcus sp. TF02-9]